MNSWQTKTIRELTTLIKDGTHGTHKEDLSGIPLLSAKDINNGRLGFDNSPRLISKDDFQSIHKGYRLQDDDVLLTIVGSLGRVAIVENYTDNYTFQRSVAILRFKPTVNPAYMYYALTDWRFQKELMKRESKGAQGGVYLGEIAKIKLLVPENPEQKRIVSVLETWDEYLDVLDQNITLKEKLKSGLIQQLLTARLRLPGFVAEWTLKDFTEIANLGKEKYNPEESNESKKNLELESIESKTGRLLKVLDSQSQSSIKTVFNKGDILYGKLRPYLRKYLRAPFDGVCSTEIWVIRAKAQNVQDFVYFLTQTSKFEQAMSKQSGSRMPRADWSIVSMTPFEIPRPEEQVKIAELLFNIDNEIATLRQKRMMILEQKKYLLKNLIRGTILTPKNLKPPGDLA